MGQPLISGLTFIKDGYSLGYPIKESIESIEPLCDEVIINVGFEAGLKDDGTYGYLREHFKGKKFRFLTSEWERGKTRDGLVLSEQTNIALAACRGKYCQYIQGDEVLHEDDLPHIHSSVMEMERRNDIEGLIFHYLHFYGNVDIIKDGRGHYRKEIRLVRNFRGITSWKDAQGFRKEGEKILAKKTNATVYHYGWARKESVMAKKVHSFEKLYHGDSYESGGFQYERIWGLKPFKKSHPRVMKKWVETNRNNLKVMELPLKHRWPPVREALSDALEYALGYRVFEYKNFIEVA